MHYWLSCAINKGGFFKIAFVVVVDIHLPPFEALAYVLRHFDALTRMVIRLSSAFIFQTFGEVCYSVVVNRSSFKGVLNLGKACIFKSLLKVYYRSVGSFTVSGQRVVNYSIKIVSILRPLDYVFASPTENVKSRLVPTCLDDSFQKRDTLN